MTRFETAVIDAIGDVCDMPGSIGDLVPQTLFAEDLGFDSGNFIELFLALEDRVEGFTLGSSRLLPEDFVSIAALAAFIERRVNGEAPEAPVDPQAAAAGEPGTKAA